jgi:hypothetical protein
MIRLLVLFILLAPLTVHAQNTDDNLAAIAQITYSDVTFQRDNTITPIALPSGATTPFGIGDTLRTDTTGRVWITLPDIGQVLMLPDSTVTLTVFNETTLSADVEGLVAFTFTNTAINLNLNTGDFTVTAPAAAFAIWNNPDTPDTIFVSDGEATINTIEQEEYTLKAGDGFNAAYEAVAELEPPLNEARLIASIAGCAGVIDTDDDENLLVRAGSAIDSLSMGAIPDGDTVEILAISANDLRYRVQYLSDFGWVEALAVETTCANLPILPVPYTEYFRTAIDITRAESNFLMPYYGPPLQDPWFYRFTSLDNVPD